MNTARQQIFETVHQLFKERHPDIAPHRACAYLAKIGIEVLLKSKSFHYRPVLQAGTMQWEIVPKHLDDGVMGTHFAFKWSPTDYNSMLAMASGGIPEMHVWIGLPDSNEIVDFSTGTFPAFVKTLKMEWLAVAPPDFLWQDVFQAAAEGHFYEPNLVATQYAMGFKL